MQIVPSAPALLHSQWSSSHLRQRQLLVPSHLPDLHHPTIRESSPKAKGFFPESNTSLLRINKRVPTLSPVGTSQIPPALSIASSSSRNLPSTNDTPTNPPAHSSTTPNTTHSFASSSYRSPADAQVGIGLSLLQDLTNGKDLSDEDEDKDDKIRRRLRYSRWSVHSGMGKDDDKSTAYKAALARAGHRTQDSMEDRTVEELMYTRSEDGDVTQRTTTLDTGKPSPILFATTSPISTLLSPCRPSLAASAALTGSWEGASDIYDDYRYSRFSMTSKAPTFSSRFSVNGAASGVTPTSPIPESRPSTRGGKSFRSRTDSVKSRQHSPLPQVLEGDGTTQEEKQNLDLDLEKLDDDGYPPLHALLKRSTLMKDRTVSMDFEASVYPE